MKLLDLFKKNVSDETKTTEAKSNVTEDAKTESNTEVKTEEKVDSKNESKTGGKASITEDIVVCPKCKQEFQKTEVKSNYYICMACGYHHTISAQRRIKFLVDPGTFRPLKCKVGLSNPLNYPDYEDKIKGLQEKTGLEEAVYAGVGRIDGYEAVIVVMSSKFLMGSMGMAVGEKVTNAIEYADKKKLPLIIFTASGGARMQEGIMSLMQMAKTSAAVEKFNENGGLYISYLTHPTTGGVTASFATLGDITLAEPEALIGFAGPRVIEQTIGQKLPEGFQRAEFQQQHGFVDQVVPRDKMRETLALVLRLHCKKAK